jgi:hypothetical protein
MILIFHICHLKGLYSLYQETTMPKMLRITDICSLSSRNTLSLTVNDIINFYPPPQQKYEQSILTAVMNRLPTFGIKH